MYLGPPHVGSRAAEDDDDLLDAPPDIDVPVSTAVSSALIHLEQAIDGMHSASPTHLSFDPLFYLALSSLPLTYPWPILTIDLKNFLPLMDRHVLTHLVAAQASVNPKFQHPAPVLSSFFKDLAHAVVHTILAPLNSQFMRPNLPPRVSSPQSSGMPTSTMLHCALTPPLRPSSQWMAWLGIRSANGIRWLLTLSSQPLTFRFRSTALGRLRLG